MTEKINQLLDTIAKWKYILIIKDFIYKNPILTFICAILLIIIAIKSFRKIKILAILMLIVSFTSLYILYGYAKHEKLTVEKVKSDVKVKLQKELNIKENSKK